MTPEQFDAHQAKINAGKKEPGLKPPVSPAVAAATGTKYRNRATGGYASRREAERAAELRLLEKAGEIRNLREQVAFELIPHQYIDGKLVERPCRYVCDFQYMQDGELVCEDVKGVRTKDYILKRKMLLWFHHIQIREI